MDLALYGRVFKRFWWLVLGGLALGIALSIFSVARVSPNGLTYRSQELWKSTSTVLLTQNGKTFSQPGTYSPLTDLYAQLANSDAVRKGMLEAGADKNWTFTAAPVPPTLNPTAVLPVIALTGQAPTAADAVKATVLGRTAFVDYVSRQKGAARIEVLQNATRPTLALPRKKTLPIIVFLAMLSATVALAFILENLRPARAKASTIKVTTAAPVSAAHPRSHSTS
jgi:hypothetical protein